ncbi:MAG: alkaline phosphatase family protein [Candidatus Aenigmarchaeota archaeon]|nr:alkaline phosphatase family protein [Candidatus Aenigmarchaeota archaeon]
MKYLMIVLDGVGDIGKTPLMIAKKPNIDKLARNGTLGLYKINYGKDVNSDVGYLSLLSSYFKNYPGRGYLEALSVGIQVGKKDVCIRGNFATLDKNRILVDRRAGREEYGLDKVCKKFNGTVVDGVRFSVVKSAGHRVVIILKGKGIDPGIVPNDPMKTGVRLTHVKAKNKKAEFTAQVINKFLEKVEREMPKMAINKKRKFPANTILIRNAGHAAKPDSFKKRFHLKSCCIAGIPIARGVARYLGIDVINVKGATGYPNTNLAAKFLSLQKNIKKYDFVFLHINATDILSHDGKYKEKIRYIEKIDKHLGKMLAHIDLKNARIAITCDHRTASAPFYKKYRHLNLPVPFMLSGPGIRAMGMKFDEKNCGKGVKLGQNKFVQFMVKK